MWADRVSGAQERPRRPRLPLQELRLQSRADTEHTSLTPLFRRLRLKDRDSATTVTCTPRRPSSITLPCAPGPHRNAIPLPCNNTTPAPQPCTLELSSSTTLEPPRTPTLGPSASESPKSPTLQILSHTKLEPPGSPTQEPCTLEFSSSAVQVSLCSPVPDPLGSTIPASQCGPVLDPQGGSMPASLCSPGQPPGSTVQAFLCSPVPTPLGSSTVPASQSSLVPSSLDSSMPASPHSPIPDPQGSMVSATLCSPVPDPQGSVLPASQSSPVLDPQGSVLPASQSSPVLDPQGSTLPASVCSPVPDLYGSTLPASQGSPVLGPQGSPVLGPQGSTLPASQSSPVLDPQGSTLPASQSSPVLDPQGSTLPASQSSPVLGPQGSSVPDSLCSPVMDSLGITVPVCLCNPVPDPQGSTTVPASPHSPVPDIQSSSVPASLCSPVTDTLGSPVPDPQGSSVPASLCSPVPDPEGSSVPASLCSPVPDPQGSPVPDPEGSSVPASLCSPVTDPQGSPVPDPEGSSVPASLCSPVPDPQGSPVPDPQGSSVPASLCSPVPDPEGSSVPASLCSPVPDPQGSPVPDPEGSSVPDSLCNLVPDSEGSTVPASLCSPVPDPQGNSMPASPCSPVMDLQSNTVLASPHSPLPEPPGSGMPPSLCSPVLKPSIMNALSSTVPSSICNPAWELCTLDFPGSTPLALLCSPFSDPTSPWQYHAGPTVQPSPGALHSGSPWQHCIPPTSSVTPVATAAAGTSVTPVATAAAGTSVTPVATAAAGTSVTPVPTAAAGTCITPRELWERSMNTSISSLVCSKDSATQTDSLLWHSPQEQLKSLPRAELEGRLESCLIIIEALSLRQQDWQESRRALPSVGPAEQRDVLTQTDVIHPKGEEEMYRNLYLDLWRKMEALQWQRGMEEDLQRELGLANTSTSTWRSQRLLLQGLVDDTFQSLQDEQRVLTEEQEQVSWCMAVLAKVPAKLRSCLEERDVMRQRAEEALRAKEEGDRFLEAFTAHASTQISTRDQRLASQQELGTLLEDAIDQQASLAAEAQTLQEFIDVTSENLEEERKALDVEWEQVIALVPRCQAMLERVPGKLRSCLEERDALRQQANEILQANKEITCQLQETSVTLQDRVAQLEQLTVANSRLSADLSSLMVNLANLQQEHDALQQEHKMQQEEIAQLVPERDGLQQECGELRRDLREANEFREFIDQENRMFRTQLLEEEARLKSTLATLQERNLQCEELMESQKHLWEEQAALSKELESTKAELLDLQLKRNKVSWGTTDISKSKLRLQELADSLRASLQEEDDNAPSSSRAWTPAPRTPGWQTPHRPVTPACRTPAYRTPYHPRSSFVGTILKAMSGRDDDEDTGDGSVFTKDKPVSALRQIEPEEGLLESVDALKAVVSDLTMLSYRIQEQEQNKFIELRKEISDLQHQLEKVTDESEEKIETYEATITKLNKKLRDKMESEKQLKDLVKQQDNKITQLIDHSAEVKRLEADVSQLKRLLQHAETEAKTLWQELRLQEPKVDTTHVQERILLRQQVDKLRQLMLDKDDEKWRISKKYMEQIKGLELKLHQVQKMLRTHEKLQEKIKEVLLTAPDIADGCPELQSLLQQCLNMEPGSGSGEAAEL